MPPTAVQQPHYHQAMAHQHGQQSVDALTTVSEDDMMMQDDDPAQRRRRISPAQLAVLRRVYNERTKYPVVALRNELAEKLGLRPRMVQVWFQNQRQQEATKRREGERDRERRAIEREHVRMHGMDVVGRAHMEHPHTVAAAAAAIAAAERAATAESVITICDGSRRPPPLARAPDGRIMRGFSLPTGFAITDVFRPWSTDCPPTWRNSEAPSAKNTRRRRRVTVSGSTTSPSAHTAFGIGSSIRRELSRERQPLDDLPMGALNAGVRRRPRRASGPARPAWADHLPADASMPTLAAAALSTPSPLSGASHSPATNMDHNGSYFPPGYACRAPSSLPPLPPPMPAAAGYAMSPSMASVVPPSVCTDPHCRSCPPPPPPPPPAAHAPHRYDDEAPCTGPCCRPTMPPAAHSPTYSTSYPPPHLGHHHRHMPPPPPPHYSPPPPRVGGSPGASHALPSMSTLSSALPPVAGYDPAPASPVRHPHHHHHEHYTPHGRPRSYTQPCPCCPPSYSVNVPAGAQ
ncbi:hypothetical protein THASP1DRAFT_21404 [Thamnocephalis sphaerospora]|uniref:Homeobox domain-containing protein n=1 Tax=Thamnocephalis sphaerospora TaxID=78915 RepID=A0A4P9XX65_9FUNG|nr:hypothetical protein THASP1DRAFT_21404 [Thamnocephalis sphaerospora]|eukprot:RKP10955.1 hypothetical protein THASP1DRAFT_21404 [Thamnocephalis sphaerospora]